MEIQNFKPMEFSDDLYLLIYGNDVNIEELKKNENQKRNLG